MEKVAGVSFQAIKEAEPQKEQLKFGAKHDNVESDDKEKRNSSKLLLGLAGIGTIVLATLAIRRGRLKNAPIKDMPKVEKVLDNVQQLKIKGGKAYNGDELYTGAYNVVKNGKSIEMKYENGILKELKSYEPGHPITTKRYEWYKNGKTAKIDITTECCDGTKLKTMVSRETPDSNILEYRSEFRENRYHLEDKFVDGVGYVNVSESCKLKRIPVSGEAEHLTEYKGLHDGCSVTFTCDKDGKLVGTPKIEEIDHSSQTYFG